MVQTKLSLLLIMELIGVQLLFYRVSVFQDKELHMIQFQIVGLQLEYRLLLLELHFRMMQQLGP